MSDAPRIEIAILDRRDVAPAGAGETALIVAAPAIANALRAATGRRFTRLPIGRDATGAG
jgi:CO/xanthine dehydrogenase Mo-binding subunit